MTVKYVGIAAVSIDGRIAPNQDANSSWTSVEDKNFLHSILDQSDLILVGRKTYEIAQTPLSRRRCLVLSSQVGDIEIRHENLILCNPSADPKSYIQKKGYTTVSVLGGARTYAYCLDHNMLDELYLTIEPITFGSGVPLFLKESAEVVEWKLLSHKELNSKGTILLHYSRVDGQ
ncbi:MAG: dihydrofolate reductase family protein [Candidatus Doudnabacteria bacterium]